MSLYQIGTLTDPQGDDEEFENHDEAVKKAFDMAIKDQNRPVAVWCDDEVVHLYLYGDRFKLDD